MYVFADGIYKPLELSPLFSHVECDKTTAKKLVAYFIRKGYWFLHSQIDTNTKTPIVRLYISEAVTIAELTHKFPTDNINYFIH